MNKYLKIFGLVIVSALMIYAQTDNASHLTRLRVSSSPSTTTNVLTDGQVEIGGTFFALGASTLSGDLSLTGANFIQYDAVNDGNPTYSIGSATAEELVVTASYASGTQSLDFILFDTQTASATADRAEFRFNVDETLILTVDDGGLEIVGGYVSTTANTFVGNQSVDGDINFVGAQAISTDAGDLTLTPIGTLVFNTVNAGVTADVGSVQGNEPITKMITQISVSANIGDAVTLPSAVAGMIIYVANDGVNAVDVFPASGDDIDEAGVNVAFSLAADAETIFVAHDATNWSAF